MLDNYYGSNHFMELLAKKGNTQAHLEAVFSLHAIILYRELHFAGTIEDYQRIKQM